MGNTSVHDEVLARLDASGHRYTRGRRAIVEALAGAAGPLTLPAMLSRSSSLTQSSAYRNLSTMEEAGVIRRLVHSDGHAHFELAEELTEHHHHMVCATCGEVRDITLDEPMEEALTVALERVAALAGFTIDRHQLDAYGRCSRCVASSADTVSS